ncbi:MAG: DNA primase [Ruminococcaceae bacterium]|nr:DNA primase [Oscillospiraceae bacterium]
MIPHSVIEDLKYRSDIVDVISSYVPLKRAGANMNGLCPFHSERSPSFTVFTGGDPHFFCFGCGAGGDVISFIMRIENLDYRSALDFLAKRAGITLPDDDAREEQGVGRKRILEMNVCAARYFRSVLNDPVMGQPGREYIEKRQLPSSVVRRFGLGYAPDGGYSLHDHLKQNGFTDEEMTAGYCCGISRKGYPYDLFRGRLMVPIIDAAGNIVAFGGRIIGEAKPDKNGFTPPKYLNSSDTPAFKKSNHLFALNYAKANASECLILCEGYMDVIMLHAAGFENAVATLGTAITPNHARIMKKYTNNVVISYDSDAAGQKAADKALRLLAEAGIDAKVLRMNGAKDPDEYIKTFGAARFRELLNESRPRFEYKMENILAAHDIGDPAEKIKAASEICMEIASVYSHVERDVYIARAAKAFSIDPKSIKNDVEAIINRRQRQAKKARPAELVREGMGLSDRVNPDFARRPKAARLEEALLGLLLLRQDYLKRAVGGAPVCEGDFPTELGRRIFCAVRDAEDAGGFNIGLLNENFTQDEVSRAHRMLSARQMLTNNGSDAYDEVLTALRAENDKIQNENADDFQYFIKKKRGELSDGATPPHSGGTT